MTGKSQLIEKINDQPVVWSHEFLERHHLSGHIYHRTQNKTYYPYWKSQLTRNSIAKKELETVGEDLAREQIEVFLLKGFSLLGEVYEDWGERFVSDIDLLISYDQLWKLTDILKMYGYEKKKVAKWLGNRHKHFFVKKTLDVPITIEIHTQLFWHTSLALGESARASSTPGFKTLEKEDQLLHLCGHIALQNAYGKLFWLMDIYKYVELYKSRLDWDEFWHKAQKAGLYKSCYFTLFVCQRLGLNLQTIFFRAPKRKRLTLYFLKKIVSFSFLYNPERFWLRRYWVRVLLNDSLLNHLRYQWAWYQRKWRD